MNFLKIAGKDIKSIAKNRFIRVSVLAILIVPLLYSLLYLYAFWDPYAKLSEVPVAVVNKDTGTVLDGQTVNYGNDIVDDLKNNTEMGWTITDEQDGLDGLNGDKYYALVEISQDFSTNVVSAKSGTPTTATITFTCNDKKNFLASQINSKVQSELKAKITKTISNNYVTVAFDSLYEAKDGMVAAADGSTQLNDGLKTLNDKLPTITNGANQLLSGSNALYTGQTSLTKGANDLNEGLATLNGKIPELSNGVNSLAQGSGTLFNSYNNLLLPGIKNINDGLSALNSSLTAGTNDANLLLSGAKDITSNTPLLIKGANDLKSAETPVKENYSKIQAGSNNLKAGVDSAIVSATNTNKELENLGASVTELLKSNPALASDKNMQNIIKTLGTLDSQKPQLEAGLSSLSKGANDLNLGITNFNESVLNPYIASTNTFSDKTAKYAEGSAKVAAGTEKTLGSISSVTDAIGKLNSGSNSIYKSMELSNVNGFGFGLASVSKGTDMLANQLPVLNTGANSLLVGSSTLKDGSQALLDGQEKLNQGISELNSGLPALTSGVTELYNGSTELSTKLSDGANEMKDGLVNSPETMGEFVSSPMDLKAESINKVSNYGTGFAPYFIPLSLWIGAIMIFFVIPTKIEEDDEDQKSSKFAKVFGKFLSFGLIGILQALLVSFVVVVVLGLRPTNILAYVLTIVFLSLVFISIIQFLIFLLGDAGRLLGIVLLIVQLTACAGTFPLEIVPKFFKVMNPFMPFTYAVEALREVISATTINYAVLAKDFVILGIALVVFLTISVLLKNTGEKITAKIEGRRTI